MLTLAGGYFVIVNVATFVIIGVDKWRAHGRSFRISERTLYQWFALGGFVGGWLGMRSFRHKTLKHSFIHKAQLISLIWIVLIASIISLL